MASVRLQPPRRPVVQQRRSRSAPRPIAVPGRAPNIRWDRVGRCALLLVLIAIVGLYIGPSLSYFSAWRESRARQGVVAKLEREQERLKERRSELRSPRILDQEARKLGMVKPGEQAYVIGNLPRSR
jgi:cell division protein FtsB